MILRGQDHYSSLDEGTSSSSSEGEILESEEETYPYEGDLLMVRRLLGNQSNDLDQSQRENLFHTRCKVLENTSLTTIPHPKPYILQRINEERGIVVNQQVNIPISIGKYKDEVLYDIMPLDASHILLGRPWQFDKKTIHDGLTNKISFHHLGKKIVLCPLSHSQRRKQKKKNDLPLKNKEGEEKVPSLEASVPSKEVVHKSHLSLKNDIKKTLLIEQPLYLFYFKETLAAISHELESLPQKVQQLLKEFDDLFPQEVLSVFPPLRGIEHQIDLIPGASLPNRPAYRTNPQETKEIESQVDDLLKNSWVQKSLSPCVVPILLVPKKDGKWRMCTDCRAINNIIIKYRLL
uniref:Transposon Ty3-I Gag-Pol polyprotein n=1 Tax=Cajanus cajan TaxID=3821 RepID=A0A151R573_CAJCA|nr:Transposon Ty3-I Gag-Pol polyprotein [Cajanus cajan]